MKKLLSVLLSIFLIASVFAQEEFVIPLFEDFSSMETEGEDYLVGSDAW